MSARPEPFALAVAQAVAQAVALTVALMALACGHSVARAADAHDETLPLSTTFGFETVRLPGGERMGLAGGALLFGADGWWIGPSVYGAASGERGGLFVFGAELQRRWQMGPGHLVAGMYAGGGGGAAAPVGGGLMLRPSLAWLYDFGSVQAGLSYSAVRFPSGDISSRQVGMVFSIDDRFHFASPERSGRSGDSSVRSGLGADRLVGTITAYSLRGGGVNERRIGLVGARAERDADAPAWGGRWRWGLEAAGAATGDAAGYMELLGTGGWDTPIGPGGAVRVGARAAIGLAGGGGVPMGGGAITKIALGASVQLSPTLSTGVEFGRLQALDSGLHAPIAQWWLAMALEPQPAGGGERQGTLVRTEWTTALQHATRAARRDGSERSLDTVGLKFSRYVDAHFYGTAQAHSAYAGGAGAYSVGLVGAGWASSARAGAWRAGGELLVGAAGGGGVASRGGAIVQALAWAGWVLQPELELRVGAGAVRSRQPGLSTPLAEISITRSFAQLAP